MSLRSRIAALLGISAYAASTPATGPDIESALVVQVREQMGGQLAPMPITQTRWFQSHLEYAEHLADFGDLSMAARMMRSVRKDGTFSGVLATRTGGLVRLPKKFYGDSTIVSELQRGSDSVRSVFDEMFPPQELAMFVADQLLLGVGVGELVPVEGRDFPVFVRLDPEWLRFRWTENRWYYQSIAGMLPITPGDGRWVLHTMGRVAPWQNGLWRAIGRAWLDKEHARMHKANWESKLANPARVAVAPQGASEVQKQSWFRAVMAWGINTVFGLTPGYDVKLLESNGQGYKSFLETIKQADRDMVIALTGSTVLVDGGTGFANVDVHAAIRADLIKDTAEALAYTINTQGIPPWVAAKYGEDALENCPVVEWDVTPPSSRMDDANALVQSAAAFTAWQTALTTAGWRLQVGDFVTKYGVAAEPLPSAPAANAAPIYAYHMAAGVVTRNEVRERLGLEPLPGAEGEELLGDGGNGGAGEGDDGSIDVDTSDLQEAA